MTTIYELEDWTKKNVPKNITVIPSVEITLDNINSVLPNNESNYQENIGYIPNCSIAKVLTPTYYIKAIFKVGEWKVLSKNNYITI